MSRRGANLAAATLTLICFSMASFPEAEALDSGLPNLVPAVPLDAFLGHVEDFDQGPIAIKFTAVIGNQGDESFEVVAMQASDGDSLGAKQCTSWVAHYVCAAEWHAVDHRQPDLFTFRWALDRFLVYELRRLTFSGAPDLSEAGLVAEHARAEVCPFDSGRFESADTLRVATNLPRFPECSGLRMGVSPGFFYFEPAFDTDQHISIEGVQDGQYALVVRVDPDGMFRESRIDDNTAYKKIEIYGSGTKLRVFR